MGDADIILGSYARAEGPQTLDQLYATYPRIDRDRLARAAADLEVRGLIRAAPGGGHEVTRAGLKRWRDTP
jgi:hypothetical protein